MNNMNNPLNMLMQFMSMGNNPQQIIQNFINQHPQAQMVFNQMKQSGLTPQQYVMQYAKQNNIDINPLLQMMSQRGVNL